MRRSVLRAIAPVHSKLNAMNDTRKRSIAPCLEGNAKTYHGLKKAWLGYIPARTEMRAW